MDDGVATTLGPGHAVGNGVRIVPAEQKRVICAAAICIDTRQIDLVGPVHEINDHIRQSKSSTAVGGSTKIKCVDPCAADQHITVGITIQCIATGPAYQQIVTVASIESVISS